MKSERHRRRLFPVAIFPAAGLLLFPAAPLFAAFLRTVEIPPCLFKSLSGLPCAACGTTRSLTLLLEGSFAGAFTVQPLAVFALFAGSAAGLLFLCGLRPSIPQAVRKGLRFAGGALVLVNWIYLIDAGL